MTTTTTTENKNFKEPKVVVLCSFQDMVVVILYLEQEERIAAIALAGKMVESLKSQAVQARLYEGKEPIQFFSIFQSFIVYKGGVSSGYKKFVEENAAENETYTEEGIALFRVQGSGPDNMQAIQVETVLLY
ncbi:villin-5-like isoform X2 [Iris pallida]|uniref:Villin-5-like isoform X2 n=1 Tax=Iris pallida TaxID=29817 RepID=A0AAX6GMR5_IRIPA|nr:villin-5-like isoform X2 [Iris pallida]